MDHRRFRSAAVLTATFCCLSLTGCQTVRAWLGPLTGSTAPASEDTAAAATLTRLGDHTLTQGDIGTAIALYQRAYQAAPTQPGPLIKLGSAYYQIGSYEQSAGAYRTALENAPSNAQALRGYGNALLAMGEPSEALPSLQQALAIENTAINRNSLGVALDMLGRQDEAQANYAAGLATSPDDLDLSSNYALSLALAGRFDEAIARARQVASAPGAQLRHRQNLALIYGLAGRDAEAGRIIREDLGDAAVQPSLDSFAQLRAITDPGARAAAIGGGAGIVRSQTGA